MDELALEFDDVFRLVVGLVHAGVIPEAVAEALRPVDGILADMSHSSRAEWDAWAVMESVAWAELRELAGVALDLLRRADFEADEGA